MGTLSRAEARWTGLLVLAVIAFLTQFAIRFADERLYADSGYYLLRTVHEGNFHIEHGRWVLALAEWPSLLGSKLGLGMEPLILLHSLANVIFLVLGGAFALFVLKDPRTVLALTFTGVIGLTHGLFCPVFELYYGVGLVILFHATLHTDAWNGPSRLAVTVLLFIGALSSHPMAWLLLAGTLFLGDRPHRRSAWAVLSIITAAFAVLRVSTMSTYEAAQLSFAQRLFFPSLVLDLFAPGVLLTQAERILRHYPDVLALVVWCAIVLWRGRRRRSLLVFMAGLFLLYVLTSLYLPDLAHDRYREQVDFGFIAWTLLVLFFRAWPPPSWRPALFMLLIACIGYRIAEAERVVPSYAERTRWHHGLIARAREQGVRKAIADPQGITFGTVEDRVSPYWSTGVESVLLSAKDGPDGTVSIITTDDLLCPGVPEHLDRFVLRCWDVLPDSYLDARWAVLPDEHYVPLR